MEDSFRSVSRASEGLFKEKGSRFIALAFPVKNEEEIREILKQVKKTHHAARHHCYAWRLGPDGLNFRVNDDGEPSSSAGKPILAAMAAEGLTNTLIVVIRYFGGILLGVPGLINAYRMAAADAIGNTEITSHKIRTRLVLQFGYPLLNEVMLIIKSGDVEIIKLTMEESCEAILAPLRSESGKLVSRLSDVFGLKIVEME